MSGGNLLNLKSVKIALDQLNRLSSNVDYWKMSGNAKLNVRFTGNLKFNFRNKYNLLSIIVLLSALLAICLVTLAKKCNFKVS